MTVIELRNELNNLINEDHGNDQVFQSIDEEGNDFKPVNELTNQLFLNSEIIDEIDYQSGGYGKVQEVHPDNVIVIWPR